MKILVTGGRGQIAGIVCPALRDPARFAYELDIYDLRDGNDIFNRRKLARRCKGKDVVLHLAAIGGPNRTKDPELYHRVNVEGTRAVARAAAKAGVPLFIHPSSDAVYGPTYGNLKPPRFPMPEDAPPPPRRLLDPYDVSKIESDSWLKSFGAKTEMTILILRLWTHAPNLASWFKAPHGRQADWLWVYVLWDDLQEAFGLACQGPIIKPDTNPIICNVASPWTPEDHLDTQAWIKETWPGIPNYTSGQETLADISNVQKYLGYHPEFKRARKVPPYERGRWGQKG